MMILLVLFFAFFFLTLRDYSLLKRDAIWAALFATNVHKYLQGLDYFAEVDSVNYAINCYLTNCNCHCFCIYFDKTFSFKS